MEGVGGGELLRVQVWGGDGCVQVGYFAGEERGEEGAYVVGEPRTGGDGVAHVDVVFGGGMPHAAGDGGGTPWVWKLERGLGGAGCAGLSIRGAGRRLRCGRTFSVRLLGRRGRTMACWCWERLSFVIWSQDSSNMPQISILKTELHRFRRYYYRHSHEPIAAQR